MDARLESAARRLRLALDLFDAGEQLMRQRLRCEHPDLPAREIEYRLANWRRERPGAPFGDCLGAPGAWPRRQP